MDRANVLIAGGGVVGTCIAWALAQRGVNDVVVVDLDLAGVYASSELNAGGVRASWWQPVNIASCAATLSFFRSRSEEFGFRQCGYLWLYADPDLWARALERRQLQNARGLGVETLTAAHTVMSSWTRCARPSTPTTRLLSSADGRRRWRFWIVTSVVSTSVLGSKYLGARSVMSSS